MMDSHKKEKRNVGEDVETSEPLGTADGNVKWYSCYAIQYEVSSKN